MPGLSFQFSCLLKCTVGTSVPLTATVNTCIIITEVMVEGETTVLGALADSVQEVMDLESDYIEPAPAIGTQLNTAFIKEIGKQNNRFVIILDIDKVFSAKDVAFAQTGQEALTSEASLN
jgi:purine-binding chemotaxis protein CheW